MEDWQQDWAKTVEAAANGLETFFKSVGKDVGDLTVALMELTDEMMAEVEQSISPAIDQIAPALDQLDHHVTEWLTPFLELESALFLDQISDLEHYTDFNSPTVEPLINQHPVCVGCRHYHGQVYNGTPFICAMHPYGVEGADTCGDKELRGDGQEPDDTIWF
jgi:hypothetical protein